MNDLPTDNALRDRIFTIEVPGYNTEEKVKIVKDFIIPKTTKNINLQANSFCMSDSVIKYLIEKVSNTSDKGIRTIEKTINNILNKLYFIVNHQDPNGNLTNFKISFNLNIYLTYPINIDIDIIDKLVKNKESSSSIISSMYL